MYFSNTVRVMFLSSNVPTTEYSFSTLRLATCIACGELKGLQEGNTLNLGQRSLELLTSNRLHCRKSTGIVF